MVCRECEVRQHLKESGIPMTVSLNELSEYLEISGRRIQELSREGVIPKNNKGRYDLIDCLSSYISYLKTQVIEKRIERRYEW